LMTDTNHTVFVGFFPPDNIVYTTERDNDNSVFVSTNVLSPKDIVSNKSNVKSAFAMSSATKDETDGNSG
jgi:hypothetical protein